MHVDNARIMYNNFVLKRRGFIAVKLDQPYRELFVWAVLFSRMPLAMIFWKECPDQIGSALAASLMLKKLSCEAKSAGKLHLSDELVANAGLVLPHDGMLCISAAYAIVRCPSVRLSVHLSCCLSRSCIVSKRVIICSNFFSRSDSHAILVFSLPSLLHSFTAGSKPIYAKYLTNGYKYGHSYYRRRIGNRTQAFECHHFQ